MIYKLNSFPHTSKYKNQGMFIIRGAMLTVCPTKKDRTKVNDLIMRSKLGLSAGRAVASALWLQSSTRRATRPPGTQLATASCRSLSAALTVKASWESWGESADIQRDASTNPLPPKPLSSHSVSALFALKIQVP